MATIDFWAHEESRCNFDEDINEDLSEQSPNIKLANSPTTWVRNQSKLSSEEKSKVFFKQKTWK